MKIGAKYKIVRRLGGATVFEKTQGPKYALRAQNRAMSSKSKPKAKSDFALRLMEKQKARYTYCVTERQFSKYAKKSLEKGGNAGALLIQTLESRLDNVALRSGLASTRLAARQMVSHGHLLVNGKIVTIPSYQVSVGEVITIREGSKKKPLFATIEEKLKAAKVPAWLKVNIEKKEITIDGVPTAQASELLFNVGSVLEFYTR
ncbi:MAG: 30S ribosomal protein S4 [Candidatus Taylorbacteria bacterium]|nr:30S ribosomal protein S4 [Candidatus Taylorbacteria bacterium]